MKQLRRPFGQRVGQSFLLVAIVLGEIRAKTQGAEPGIVSTFAGTGVKGYSGDGGPATQAQFNNVFAVSRGPDGFLYVCDTDNHRIRRISPEGIVTTYAGCERIGYEGDGGVATRASLMAPYEMVWDRDKNFYFVDIRTHTVRRIDARTNVITTVAGMGQPGFSGDEGPANKALLDQPHSLAFDGSGDLYVCDILNHRIRKITMATGIITTWSGTGEKKTASDGSPITGSSLHGPRAIAFSSDGKCWLALREGNALLLLDPKANKLTRMAGTGKSGFTGNGGPALEAKLAGPKCVGLGLEGNVYLADTESHSIRYLDVKKGTVEVLVGNGSKGDGPDGNDPEQCQLARPHGVFVDHDGAVYIGDSENHRVRVWRKR